MARLKYYNLATKTWEYADESYSPSKPGGNDFDLSEQVDRAETAAAAAEAAAARAEDAAERAEEAANGVGSGGNADYGAENAGKLLYVGADGKATVLALGAGLAIENGVLILTGGGGQGILVTDDGNGNVTVTNVTVTDDGNGNVVVTGNVTVTDDGNGNVTLK